MKTRTHFFLAAFTGLLLSLCFSGCANTDPAGYREFQPPAPEPINPATDPAAFPANYQ